MAAISVMTAASIRKVSGSCSKVRPSRAPPKMIVPSVSGTASAKPTTPSDHWKTTLPINCPIRAPMASSPKTWSSGRIFRPRQA